MLATLGSCAPLPGATDPPRCKCFWQAGLALAQPRSQAALCCSQLSTTTSAFSNHLTAGVQKWEKGFHGGRGSGRRVLHPGSHEPWKGGSNPPDPHPAGWSHVPHSGPTALSVLCPNTMLESLVLILP